MFKFRWFRIIFFVFIVIGGVLFYQHEQNTDNPICKDCNLILISVDTLRPDHMGVYGYDKNTTPNIDRWAKNAVVYMNAYTEVPMTFPSFVLLMTGKDVVETGIYSNRVVTDPDGVSVSINSDDIQANVVTLAQKLKRNHYYNAAFLSNPELSSEISTINRGFDKYEIINKTSPQEYEQFMIGNAMQTLKNNKKKKLFLWLHFIDPHSPYFPPKEFRCKFGQNNCQEINTLGFAQLEEKRKLLEGCQQTPLDNHTVNVYESLYDGEIAYTDNLIGKILDELDKNQLTKNTIVIFYSDHGEGFGPSYYFNHPGTTSNATTKIPFIMYNPKIEAGINKNLVQNNDIYSMILSSIGVETELPNRKYVYGVTINKKEFSINDGKYKYIYFFPYSCNSDREEEKLYDIITDPKEQNNILKKNPQIAKKLKAELFKHFGEKMNTDIPTPQIRSGDEYRKDTLDQIKNLGY